MKEKLGPILWQFPPNMKFYEQKFKTFFKLLPKDLRHAIEIRNDTFNDKRFIELLRKYNLAYVISDSVERWFYDEHLTSDFVYVRLHGFNEIYAGSYTGTALSLWAKKIKKWQRGKDVFVHFDNNFKVNAPFDAVSLILKLQKLQGLVLPEINPRETLNRKRVKKVRTQKAP